MIIKNTGPSSGIHVDFVPMVDVLFNLLIFFLLFRPTPFFFRQLAIVRDFRRDLGGFCFNDKSRRPLRAISFQAVGEPLFAGIVRLRIDQDG